MISFKNVSYLINRNLILDNINFNIKDGEKVLIVGNSGTGKTTIFNLLNLNILPTKGHIFVDNQDITLFNNVQKANYLKDKVRMIYQEDDLYPYLSVNDNLLLYFYQKDIDYYLKKTSLISLKNKKVKFLSGGERQRIAIIKNCMSDFNVLLCDEITSALDDKNALKFIDFILKLFPLKTIIFISHNINIFQGLIDHYIYLDNKKIKEDVINDLGKIKNVSLKVKKRSNLDILFKNGLRKINIFLLIIYLLSILCFSIYFNYEKIFTYLTNRSFYNYFDYNLYEIKNLKTKIDDENILEDLSLSLQNINVYLNDQCFLSINIKPFYNLNDTTSFYVSKSLIESLNFENLNSIALKNENIYFKSDKIAFINESGMFATSAIFYNYQQIKNNLSKIIGNNYLYYSEDIILENEIFTSNPLFEDNDNLKPYLENNALLDYLTYQMVFNSIKQIIEYFVIIIFFYSLIVSSILVLSIIIKNIKQIAILLSHGINIYQILFSHLIPVFIYFLISLIIFLKINLSLFILGIFFGLAILIFANIIGIIYLQKKSLNNLLKDDFLC